MQNTKKIVVVLVVIVVLVIMIVFSLLLNNKNNSKYEGELTIANIEDYTKGKPSNKDSLDYIQYDLFRTVNLNQSKPVEKNSIPDVLIRSGTFQQKTDSSTGVTTVTFIVDIESLKQSYGISYQWDADGTRLASGIDEWGTVVKCLPEEELIYGTFSCKDMFSEMSADSDPILAYLPHSALDYNLSAIQDKETNSTKPILIAELLLTMSDVRTGREAAIAAYTQEVRDYITSLGLNPDDYTIQYSTTEPSSN